MKDNIEYVDLDIELISPDEKFAVYYKDGCKTNFAVSTEGRIYNMKTGNLRKPRTRPDGHNDINLSFGSKESCRTMLVYRMVAETFLEGQDKENGINTVDHLNGTEYGDGVANLEWVSQSENTIRAGKQGRMKKDDSQKGENNPCSVYTESQIRLACELNIQGIGRKEISEITGIKIDYLQKIFTGKKWAHVTKDYDIKIKKTNHYPDDVRVRIRELDKEGKKISEIQEMIYNEFNIELSYSYVKDAKRIRKR